MNKFYMAALGAVGAALAFPIAANAAPLGAAAPVVGLLNAETSNIIDVQRRVYRGGRGYRGGPVYRGGRGYWRGHRGYRYARPGYRYRDGFWFPPAAFAAGAILGGALAGAASGPAYAAPAGLGPEHYEWCEDRYKSYRASDNSFQPYEGPRRECVSPYS